MALGSPIPGLGTRTVEKVRHFACPNCGGGNGENHYIWMGFALDGPWSTRCADCGWCDRCGKADVNP